MRTMVIAGLMLVSAQALALPKVGEVAPDFAVPDETGAVVKLKDLRGVPVVLYSYPRDDTPGCTAEAKAFTESHDKLQALGAVVLGVSTQDAESHKAFKQKHGIGFPLLVDDDKKLLRAYGFLKLGIISARHTVLIGPDGRVAAVWEDVKVDGHDDAVIAAIEVLLKKPATTK